MKKLIFLVSAVLLTSQPCLAQNSSDDLAGALLAIGIIEALFSSADDSSSETSTSTARQYSSNSYPNSRYWDCEVSIYSSGSFGRGGLFGDGAFIAEKTIEVQAPSRSLASSEADNMYVYYKGKDVCKAGGIDDSNCKYWRSPLSPSTCYPQ